MNEVCPACKGRGKINFGMTICPKCRGKAAPDEPQGSSTTERPSSLRAATSGLTISAGEGADQEMQDLIKEALKDDLAIQHSFKDGKCSCGKGHTPKDLSEGLKEKIDDLKKKHPELADFIVPVPMNLVEGRLGAAFNEAKAVISSTKSRGFDLTDLSALTEDFYEAWAEDNGIPKFGELLDMKDEQAKMVAGAMRTLHLVACSLFLVSISPSECSPPMQCVLAEAGARIRQDPSLVGLAKPDQG